MNAIVAVDKNWAIGSKNDLLVRIPADQRYFRQETTGKVIIMGRKTLESFPQGKPLPNRTNIVLTKNTGYKADGAIVFNSIEEVLEYVKDVKEEDIYVIGGGSVYRQMLPYCNMVQVTKIAYTYEADTYFPNLDEMPEWKIVKESEEQTYYDLEYVFYEYRRQ